MTILSAAQSAAFYLNGSRPSAVVSNQNTFETELAFLAQEAATDIAKAADWQELTEFYELEADGIASAYPFPADYDRMVQASDIYDPDTWCWGYQHFTDYGQWINYTSRGYNLAHGAWIIRKNQFFFSPMPEAGKRAIFPYISKNIFLTFDGVGKPEITRDDDSFVLDERLLKLAIIWRWKASKQMDYQEDLRNYEMALSQEMARDKGSQVIRDNGMGQFPNAVKAWPWELGT
jgi:hypothetical protein